MVITVEYSLVYIGSCKISSSTVVPIYIYIYMSIYVCVYIYIHIQACICKTRLVFVVVLQKATYFFCTLASCIWALYYVLILTVAHIMGYMYICIYINILYYHNPYDFGIWVVVKLLVPFWGPGNIRCHIILRTKNGTIIFDNHPDGL